MVNFPLLGNYGRPTDPQTDRAGRRGVTLPTMEGRNLVSYATKEPW